MSLLVPLGLLALLTLPIIVFLHMLRERRRRVVVPSLLLWQLLPHNQSALRRRRLSLTLLLLLHLLVAALLSLALAHPQWNLIGFGSERHLALIIDTSISMAAPGFVGSRLDDIRSRARILMRTIGARGSVTLIGAGPQARALAVGGIEDLARLEATLDSLTPAGAGTDITGALTLAEAAVQGRRGAEIVVLTDAALPALAATFDDRSVEAPLRWEVMNNDAANRAIVLFAARPRSSVGAIPVYARIANYSDSGLRTMLRLYGDETLLDSRPLLLQPNGEVELTWGVPRGVSVLRAELDGNDGLPADDQAVLSLETYRPLQALLVSDHPATMERALHAIPGLALNTVAPADYTGSTADLTVFESFLPSAWPAGGVLAINPPPGSPLLTVNPAPPPSPDPTTDSRLDGAVLFEGINLSSDAFGPAVSVTPPDEATALLRRGDQPLILRWRTATSEIAVWTFDLSQGNLTTRLAFPLLAARTVRDLTPPPLPSAVLSGTTVTLQPDPRATAVVIVAPDGTSTTLDIERGRPTEFAFMQPGLYKIVERAGERILYEGRIGVNAGAALESDLRPQPTPPPAAADSTRVERTQTGQPLWPWLIVLALIVILGEWMYVHRRRARGFAEG